MKILVTGAKGFVGHNLCLQLRNIMKGKAMFYSGVTINEVYEYDIDTPVNKLEEWCAKCDFVFHLAGINRPLDKSEYMSGNFGFSSVLLEVLKRCGNRCPIVLSSSQQASLEGRFAGSEYGFSKKATEELFLSYGVSFGVEVLVYRFPNLFGKWCRPNYNSAVATFCHNIANDLPINVNDPAVELELLYIDDLVDEMIGNLKGQKHRCEFRGLDVIPDIDGRYCYVPNTYTITLGEIVDLLNVFENQRKTLIMPEIPSGSFAKKLYSTYLSYLPESKVSFALETHVDDRGSFTELLKTLNCGQFSVNVSNPGVTKGQHWHNTKWEFFIVVYGKALIQQRKIDTDKILNFEVSGDCIKAVHMLPGYTHNIINLSHTEPLITLMWANEIFDKEYPDTFSELV